MEMIHAQRNVHGNPQPELLVQWRVAQKVVQIATFHKVGDHEHPVGLDAQP